jgi:nucleotide-binding universal stress UspA family protein
MFTLKKILVPTDFSQSSERALEKALDLAEEYKAKVTLLHVDENVRQCAADYCLATEEVMSAEEDNARKSRELMEKEARTWVGKTHVEIEFDIKKGKPDQVILEEQERLGSDLIVIGTHGEKGFLKKHHILGSVADKVVHKAKSPVMVIRA